MKNTIERNEALQAIERNLDLLVQNELNRNTHWADKHLTSMKKMFDRVKNENVKATASFYSMEEARKLTYQTLFNHLLELDKWLDEAYSGEQKVFSWIFPEVIGYGCFKDDEMGLLYGTNKCKVILEKTNNSSEFAIVSSIPWMDQRFKIEL